MNKTELCFTPAVKLARMIREREISPVELTQAVLERIEAVNPQINAYCTLVPEFALRAAQEAEKKVMKKEELGPLHGIPLSIKDLTPTKGIRTTWGSRYYKDFVPQEDALVVQRLKAAGAIILGKTNTPEFGIGINTTNSVVRHHAEPVGPIPDRRRFERRALPRPSLRASALSPTGATWEDRCGSRPASAGWSAFASLRESIPKYPNYWGWDSFSVQGPMARTVPDTALMLSVMAGFHDQDPISVREDFSSLAEEIEQDYRGKRVAWSPDLGGLCPVEPEVVRICRAAAKKFEELGCTVEEASPDFQDIMEIIEGLRIGQLGDQLCPPTGGGRGNRQPVLQTVFEPERKDPGRPSGRRREKTHGPLVSGAGLLREIRPPPLPDDVRPGLPGRPIVSAGGCRKVHREPDRELSSDLCVLHGGRSGHFRPCRVDARMDCPWVCRSSGSA